MVSAVSVGAFAILPSYLVLLLCLFLLGLLIFGIGFDKLLLTEGAKSFIPESVSKLIEERELFQLWVDFVREYNPIMIFLRLTGKPTLSLNP